MLNKIRNKLEKTLPRYLASLDADYSVSRISGLLFCSIKEFVLREGKRVRPTLFVVGYLGFSRKAAPGLYTSALSLELLHDFMLVHDDIIDKSDLRRGKPAMHKMLGAHLAQYRNIKFNGEELAIVLGDVMYALALHTFLSVQEDPVRKEKALKKLIEAAIYTGGGEFIELLSGTKAIEEITQSDIYKIYDLKTAYYTFACPLAMGAILGGATDAQADNLLRYGLHVGRGFQIKDDILGMFSAEKEIGKSSLTDLKEAKKTLLIWYAYRHATAKEKSSMKRILRKRNADMQDLRAMRKIIVNSGALIYAQKTVQELLAKANLLLKTARLKPAYKKALASYSQKILAL